MSRYKITVDVVRYIVHEYQTKTIQKIYEGMLVTHPHLKLSKNVVGNIIKECRLTFERKAAECRANMQYKEAAAIEARKYTCLPDKRSKFRSSVDQVVDQDIIENVVNIALIQPNKEDKPANQ